MCREIREKSQPRAKTKGESVLLEEYVPKSCACAYLLILETVEERQYSLLTWEVFAVISGKVHGQYVEKSFATNLRVGDIFQAELGEIVLMFVFHVLTQEGNGRLGIVRVNLKTAGACVAWMAGLSRTGYVGAACRAYSTLESYKTEDSSQSVGSSLTSRCCQTVVPPRG